MPFTIAQLPITEAVYSFVEHDGTATHIAASTLLATLEAYRSPKGERMPVTTIHMDAGLLRALERGDLGVEVAHTLRLPEAALERPGIIGQWGEHHISIDGAHRVWRRWKHGDRTFAAYVVPEALWRMYVITDMPGDGATWREINKQEYRTPEFEALLNMLRAVGDI